jgi:Siphovirus ReqiPepy6 Gp37-like protein
MRLLIEARYPDLTPAGIVEGYSQAVIVCRHNGLGAWQITLPAASLKAEIRDAWEARGGIRITDADRPDSDPLLSGPLTGDAESWGEENRFGGDLVISGVSDERVLAARIVYPDPGSPWDSQGAASHHAVGPAPAHAVIWAYVHAHAGPGALATRQWPGLTLQASPGAGGIVEGNERFTNLLELCQSLALAGGTSFRVAQTAGGGLLFSQSIPVLRPDVLLAADAGTLRGGSASIQAPDLTRALVAGQGEQEARLLVERADAVAEAEWGARVERLVDARQASSSALLEQSGDQALLEGAAKGSFSVQVQDTDDIVFGRDYQLGDVVPYEVRGVVLEDVVREVKLTAQGGRTVVTPTIGPAAADSTPAVYKRLEVMERAIRALRNA